VDLGNPAHPVHSASVKLADGFGHSLLVKNGLQVLTSHWEPVAGTNKVKFYLDRVAFPAIGLPLPATSLNVPGALLSYDEESSHALTIDFQWHGVVVQDEEECWSTYGWNTWLDSTGGILTCSYLEQTLKLIAIDDQDVSVLDDKTLDTGFYFHGTQVTESRVFAQGYSYQPGDDYSTYSVVVLGDVGADEIHIATQELPAQDYLWPVAAEGDHLVLASYQTPGIHVLDASDMDDMVIERKGDVTGYVSSVTLDNDRALCAMGPYGLEVVDLQ
jgi:hypothetical protein